MTLFGEICPHHFPAPPKKMGVNRQFQAKTPKYIFILITISQKLLIRSWWNLKTTLRPTIALRRWSKTTYWIKSNMAGGRHLRNGNDLTTPPRVVHFDKFCRSKQGGTLMTQIRSKSKAEIELKYGGRPFSETGSSFIAAVDWCILPKYGMQIHF